MPPKIVLGSGETTVVPSMNQGAFADLVIMPILKNEQQGKASGDPVDIKLSLADGKQLTGKLALHFKDVYLSDISGCELRY